MPNAEGMVITGPGTYRIPRLGATLHVDVSDGIVRFYATNAAGDRILDNDDWHASNYQSWELCWDKQDRVWFLSSDIGDVYWEKGPDGSFTRHDIEDYTSIPKAMKLR